MPRPSEKAEALGALSAARKMLDAPEPLTGVRKVQFRGLLEYAEEMVTQVQEVKKRRALTPRQEELPHE